MLLLAINPITKLFKASYIIRLDKDKLSHYLIGDIPWKEITRISLMVIEHKNVKSFVLHLKVINLDKYSARFSLIEKKLNSTIQNQQLRLTLPTSEYNARLVESLTNVFAKNASAPTMETKLNEAQKLTAEIFELSKSPPSEETQKKLSLKLEQHNAILSKVDNEVNELLDESKKAHKNTVIGACKKILCK